MPDPTPSDYHGHRLDLFRPTGLDRGRPKHTEALWYFVKVWFFLSPWPWPVRFKRWLLIRFGAKVGKGLYMRPRVGIHFPWKLTIGDHCWVGDGVEILNLEPVTLEDHVVIGHQAYLAAGSHDARSRSMAYANKPIVIRRGTWIATRAFIGPGVTVGENCVVGACAVVMKSVPDDSVVTGQAAQVAGRREIVRD